MGAINRRLPWSKRSFYVSVSEIEGDNPVTLTVEKEPKSELAYEWTVSGFCESREMAFDRAEQAAIAAASTPYQGSSMTRELHRLVADGKAYLVIDGRRDDAGMLLQVIRAAMQATKDKP